MLSTTRPVPLLQPLLSVGVGRHRPHHRIRRAVTAQVEFERHSLKLGLIFKGKGLKPVAFKAYGSTEFNVYRPAMPPAARSSSGSASAIAAA
jgi:hypothetical protein